MNKNNQATILQVNVVREIAVFLCQQDAHEGEDRSQVSKLFRDTFYGRKACASACFIYNDFGLRSEPPLGSTFEREYSRIFYTANGGPNSLAKKTLFPTFVVVYARDSV